MFNERRGHVVSSGDHMDPVSDSPCNEDGFSPGSADRNICGGKLAKGLPASWDVH